LQFEFGLGVARIVFDALFGRAPDNQSVIFIDEDGRRRVLEAFIVANDGDVRAIDDGNGAIGRAQINAKIYGQSAHEKSPVKTGSPKTIKAKRETDKHACRA